MEIKELQIITNQLEETERFYTEILNVPTQERTGDKVSFLIGRTKLSFVLDTALVQPVYHMAFDIPKNQLMEAYNWLKQRINIIPVSPETDFSSFELWNAKSFYFHDNNDNVLELICRYDLDNESDIPFDGSLLAVSEIGIVSDDVPFLAETIMNKYGLEVYEKQPAQDNFTVLGDEQGLLILVNEDRNWYPTTQKAKLFPIKMVINNGTNGDQDLNIS